MDGVDERPNREREALAAGPVVSVGGGGRPLYLSAFLKAPLPGPALLRAAAPATIEITEQLLAAGTYPVVHRGRSRA